jgi:opacity protein-like surface antigen
VQWTRNRELFKLALVDLGLAMGVYMTRVLRGSIALLALGALVAAQPARAADMPLPQAAPIAYSWTGFYLGGTVGGAWGSLDPTTSTGPGTYFGTDTPAIAAINAAGLQSIKPSAVTGGLEFGYNWQSGHLVFGFESDIESIRLSGGTLTTGVFPPAAGPVAAGLSFAVGSAASSNWLFTARPRIGWANDNWLIYATGGLAVTTLNAQSAYSDDVFGSSESGLISSTRAGYAVGGGVEAGLWDRWSVKAEYLYVNFSTTSATSNNLVAFPAVPLPGQSFTHSVDLKANIARVGLNYRFGGVGANAYAADLAVKASPPPQVLWSWTGGYIGGQIGGSFGTTDFNDPFGKSIFGDNVRTPGFFFGGQIGYNWQLPGSRWVFGVEGDISGMDSDGTATCFASSALALNDTCRVRPQVQGTATGRVGYALGPAGHTLAYVKGGLAWVNDRVDMAMNNALVGLAPAGLPITSVSQNVNLWGGTVGAGIEQALTPAWTLKVEYDYLGLGRGNITNLGSPLVAFDGTLVAFAPPGTSGVTQNLHEMKVGLNYRIGADPSASWLAAAAPAYPVKAAPPPPTWLPGWEAEVGGRYFGSWGQFHKDLGQLVGSGFPSISSVSRLTYDDMQTNAGEFFGRVDSPWNLFLKVFVGGGSTRNGHMNDEDFGIPLNGIFTSYSNTLSSAVTGATRYGAVDVGFDVKRGPDYKIGLFAGYFWFNQDMNAFGCTPLSGTNCIPAIPALGNPGATEADRWRAVRLGAAGETMLTDRVKLSGEVAYLPSVKFNGVDQHFLAPTAILASDDQESGNGRGVQLEALLSYYITPQFSVGVGGRYWALWTSNAQTFRDFDSNPAVPTPLPPQYFKGVVEQAGVLVQASYRFGAPGVVVAKY